MKQFRQKGLVVSVGYLNLKEPQKPQGSTHPPIACFEIDTSLAPEVEQALVQAGVQIILDEKVELCGSSEVVRGILTKHGYTEVVT